MKSASMDAMESTSTPGRKAGLIVLVAIVLLTAFGLRLWRIDGPYDHIDELIARHVSHHLATHPGWDNNWRICEIPYFSDRDQYNFSSYLYATHFFRRAIAPMMPVQWREDRQGVVVHRLFSVICGTVAVGLLMVVAGRIAGPLVMLLAGALAAGNVQLVLDAHYARPESFMSMVALAVVWLGLLPIARIWRPTLMAFLVGLLAATKMTNTAFLALAIFAAWQVWRERNLAESAWRPAGLLVAAGALSFFVGWALGAPFALLHPQAWIVGLQFLQAQYSGVHAPYSMPDHGLVWPIMRDYFVSTHGLPLLMAIGLGGAVCLWRRQWAACVLLLLPVAGYATLFGVQRVFVERNLSPVLPSALLLGVMGFVALVTWLWRSGSVRIGITAATAVLLALVTGERALGLLLREGLTEIEPSRNQAYLSGLKRDFPKQHQAFTSLYNDTDMDWLRGEVQAGQGEVLLTVVDFSDAYKVKWLPVMEKLFTVLPVAEYRGTFADYPLSGLNNFHGCRLRTYVVRLR